MVLLKPRTPIVANRSDIAKIPIIRQLLLFVREKVEFLRMSLMKIPGHAPESI